MYLEKGEVLNLEQKTITSVEVAEMVGKDHSKLLRDIRNYIDQFNQSKIGFVEFFQKVTIRTVKEKYGRVIWSQKKDASLSHIS